MISKPHRDMFVEFAWFSGLVASLVAAISVTLMQLEDRRSDVPNLQQEVMRKEQDLRARLETPDSSTEFVELLSESEQMVVNESERVSTLSGAAHDTGVTLVEIRSLEPTSSEDGAVLSGSHRLAAVGSYRQLARFLGAVSRASGTVGIDDFEISRAVDSSAETLRATLRVTWYASGPDAGRIADGEG